MIKLKKIVPFKKEILFKTNLSEIISISLEHTLAVEKDNFIKGKFIVSGEYKMLETSVNTEKFSYDLPFTVDMDERYILDKAIIDIDDFYYEIINDNILKVNIDVLIDNLEQQEIPVLEEKELVRTELPVDHSISVETVESRCIEEEDKQREEINIFGSIEGNETYKSYTVYIVRENDTIDQIIQKYNTSKENIELYNDISELKIGDKIVIPSE